MFLPDLSLPYHTCPLLSCLVSGSQEAGCHPHSSALPLHICRLKQKVQWTLLVPLLPPQVTSEPVMTRSRICPDPFSTSQQPGRSFYKVDQITAICILRVKRLQFKNSFKASRTTLRPSGYWSYLLTGSLEAVCRTVTHVMNAALGMPSPWSRASRPHLLLLLFLLPQSHLLAT